MSVSTQPPPAAAQSSSRRSTIDRWFHLTERGSTYSRGVRGVREGIVTTLVAMVVEAVAQVGPQSSENPTGWGLNVPTVPTDYLASPNFGLLGQFSLFGSFQTVGFIASSLAVFSLTLSDFFGIA